MISFYPHNKPVKGRYSPFYRKGICVGETTCSEAIRDPPPKKKRKKGDSTECWWCQQELTFSALVLNLATAMFVVAEWSGVTKGDGTCPSMEYTS